MILYEDVQSDVIDGFQKIIDQFNDFEDACKKFADSMESTGDAGSEANYFYDFIREEARDQLNYLKEAILDEYYPVIDSDEDGLDPYEAGDIYRERKKERENIFK